MPRNLAGRDIDETAAKDKADAIVVAKILEIGRIDPGAPGQAYHDNAMILISNALSGNLSGPQTMSFTVQRFPEEISEVAPQVGESLVIFLSKRSDGLWHAIKMLPATDDTIKRIKQMLGH